MVVCSVSLCCLKRRGEANQLEKLETSKLLSTSCTEEGGNILYEQVSRWALYMKKEGIRVKSASSSKTTFPPFLKL